MYTLLSEYFFSHPDIQLSILILNFKPIKILAVFTACVEFVSGWQHAWNNIYRHIGRIGLGWIDEQKSPIFRRGKSGNLADK